MEFAEKGNGFRGGFEKSQGFGLEAEVQIEVFRTLDAVNLIGAVKKIFENFRNL